MSKDLYRILGARRNARPETIKGKYRALAKKHHPDIGGDSDDFDAIHEAYTVLMDAERRRRYDETGEYETAAADNAHARVISVLMLALDTVVATAIEKDVDLRRQDVCDAVRQVLRGRMDDLSETGRKIDARITAYQSLRDRFSVPAGEPNEIEAGIAANIAALWRQHDQFQQGFADLEGALALSRKYLYRSEAMAACRVSTWDGTTTASTGGVWT